MAAIVIEPFNPGTTKIVLTGEIKPRTMERIIKLGELAPLRDQALADGGRETIEMAAKKYAEAGMRYTAAFLRHRIGVIESEPMPMKIIRPQSELYANQEARIMKLIRESGKGLKPKDIAKKIHIQRDALSRRLACLRASGQLVTNRNNVYNIAPERTAHDLDN